MAEAGMMATTTLVAVTPAALPGAQADLATWCQGQILALAQELREARQNLRDVKRLMLGSPRGWQNVIRKTVLRMIYFAKIKAAVRAGYLLVPGFPAEVIAVRVGGTSPPFDSGAYPTQINTAKPDLSLPPGKGRYVDEMLPSRDHSYTLPATPQAPRGELVRRHTVGHAYGEVDFPFQLVQPVVLAATEAAMALKIFDRIGVAHGPHTTSRAIRKSDPIVVGQILDGSQKYPTDKVITFFIAWWMDPRSL